MEETYTIILADGTRLEGLRRNGTNYISDTLIADAAIFENNCSPLFIRGGETEEVIDYAELVHISQEADGCYIAFREISEREIREAQMRADIDYLAMMTDTDLEEV